MNRRQRRTQWQASQRLAADSSLAGAQGAAAAPGFSAIRMQVGELVLRGFDRRFASRVAAAFEESLSDRLRSATLPARLQRPMRTGHLRLAPLKPRRSSDAATMGDDLARAVLALETSTRRRGGWR